MEWTEEKSRSDQGTNINFSTFVTISEAPYCPEMHFSRL